MDTEKHIVIVGAGVVGLTVALRLTENGFKNVTITAKHMPADRDPEYTSPWAGANVALGQSKGGDSIESAWETKSFHELVNLANSEPGAGVWIQKHTTYHLSSTATPDKLNHWFKDLVFDYKILSKNEVPVFADWGVQYRTISLDPSIYLHWLQSKCLGNGVQFKRRTLKHIKEAFAVEENGAVPAVVVNCTGLLSSKLGGVEDQDVEPVRGQLVVVANESNGMFGFSGFADMDPNIGECFYIIDRPAGGGTAIGGSNYVSWSTEPDMALAERMMQRAIKVCPHLVPDGQGIEALRVIRHQVGFRPYRKGGARIEIDKNICMENGIGKVVHCYGLGSAGFQRSYGVADKAVELVHECIKE